MRVVPLLARFSFKTTLQCTSGQTQLVSVVVMSAVMMTSALFALQRAQQVHTQTRRSARRTEALAGLAAGARLLQKFFQTEAACDPAQLDLELDQLCDDGTRCSTGSRAFTAGTRHLLIPTTSALGSIVVSFGRVMPIDRVAASPITGSYSAGAGGLPNPFADSAFQPLPTQDATVPSLQTLWSPPRDTRVEVWARLGNFRVDQTVVLLNVCTHPMLIRTGSTQTVVTNPSPNLALGAMPASDWRRSCDVTAQNFGDLNDDGYVDGFDLELLQEYLRTGLVPDGLPVAVTEPVFAARADLSCDGVVDEMDFGVFEKGLRGYLWRIPLSGTI